MRVPALTVLGVFGGTVLAVCRAVSVRAEHQQHLARHRCGCAGKLCRCSLGGAANSRRFFGAALATATRPRGYAIPRHPAFPAELRALLEPHLSHCRAARAAGEAAYRAGSGGARSYARHMARLRRSGMARELDFGYDGGPSAHPLRAAFLAAIGLPPNADLSRLHEQDERRTREVGGMRGGAKGGTGGEENGKERAMASLARPENRVAFQAVFDRFVRGVCVPQLAALVQQQQQQQQQQQLQDEHKGEEEEDDVNEEEGGELVFYYQAFPCVRVVQPGEFSIGPHADVSYGHSPASINFYVPLTRIGDRGGSSSLWLESEPGKEDWHPIEGGGYGAGGGGSAGDDGAGGEYHADTVKRFAGGICAHWTSENRTGRTRVSLDFRVVAGPLFHALRGSAVGGEDNSDGNDGRAARDIEVYRKAGYYSKARFDAASGTWQREGPMLPPDARFGFPWTRLKKKKKKEGKE